MRWQEEGSWRRRLGGGWGRRLTNVEFVIGCGLLIMFMNLEQSLLEVCAQVICNHGLPGETINCIDEGLLGVNVRERVRYVADYVESTRLRIIGELGANMGKTLAEFGLIDEDRPDGIDRDNLGSFPRFAPSINCLRFLNILKIWLENNIPEEEDSSDWFMAVEDVSDLLN